MDTLVPYLLVKLLHIFTAIVALGTSAGLGILLEFYGDDRVHGAYVLRAIHRIEAWFVLPGYVVMLLTGAWLAGQAWGFALRWLQAALALWVVGALCLGAGLPVLGRQLRLLESGGGGSARYGRLSLLSRGLGAAFGLAIVLILYLMVVKPPLDFLP